MAEHVLASKLDGQLGIVETRVRFLAETLPAYRALPLVDIDFI